MYNITGRTCGDISMSLFCPCCTLIQIDREIRAREGQENLRTNRSFQRHKVFIKSKLERRQPRLVPPMVYAPSRGVAPNRVVEEPERDRSPLKISLKLPSGINSAAGEESKRRKKLEDVGDCRRSRANSLVKVTADVRTQSKDVEQDVGPVGRAFASRLGVAPHPISECPPRRDMVEKSTAKQLSQHELAECSSTSMVPRSMNSSKMSHFLEDCTIVQNDSQSATVQHKLTECDTVATSSGKVEVHSLTECDTITTNYTGAAEQHEITECDTLDSTSTEVTEQHPLKDCGTVAVVSARMVEQHPPAECITAAVDFPKSRELDSSKTLKKGENASHHVIQQLNSRKHRGAAINPLWPVAQHSLTDCDIAATPIEVVQQHPLTECQTAAVSSQRSIEQHPLQESDKVVIECSEPLRQHGLTECNTTAVGFLAATKQHALPECTMIPVVSPTIAQQHIFIECKWEGPTSPVAVEQHLPGDGTKVLVDLPQLIEQHLSGDCTEVPFHSSPVVEQHDLIYCETSDAAGVQGQDFSYAHDFTDCPALNYYEREEKKARQHTFANCPRTSSMGSQSNPTVLQHALIDCTVNGKATSRAASVSSTIKDLRRGKEHRVASCPVLHSPGDNKGTERQRSRAASVSQSIRSHRRPSDTSSHKGKGPEQHRLASCAVPDSPNVNSHQDEQHSHDVSCLTQSLHHKHSSEEIVQAKDEVKDPEPETLAASDSHDHDVSCLTESRHHKRHSREDTSGHGSSGGAISSENQHRRRRHKKKNRHAKFAEQTRTQKTTAGDGSNSARNSNAQVALTRVLASQQKWKE